MLYEESDTQRRFGEAFLWNSRSKMEPRRNSAAEKSETCGRLSRRDSKPRLPASDRALSTAKITGQMTTPVGFQPTYSCQGRLPSSTKTMVSTHRLLLDKRHLQWIGEKEGSDFLEAFWRKRL